MTNLKRNRNKKRMQNETIVIIVIPPTVAPMSATSSNIGMLKKEFSAASQVSAKASRGVAHTKALVKRNAIVEDFNRVSLCQDKYIDKQMVKLYQKEKKWL